MVPGNSSKAQRCAEEEDGRFQNFTDWVFCFRDLNHRDLDRDLDHDQIRALL